MAKSYMSLPSDEPQSSIALWVATADTGSENKSVTATRGERSEEAPALLLPGNDEDRCGGLQGDKKGRQRRRSACFRNGRMGAPFACERRDVVEARRCEMERGRGLGGYDKNAFPCPQARVPGPRLCGRVAGRAPPLTHYAARRRRKAMGAVGA